MYFHLVRETKNRSRGHSEPVVAGMGIFRLAFILRQALDIGPDL